MKNERAELLAAVKRSRAEVEASQDAMLKARDEYVETVRELHTSGMSLREIAAELDLSHQRVHQMIYEDLPSEKSRARLGKGSGIAALVLLAVLGAAVLVASPWDGTADPGGSAVGSSPSAAPADREVQTHVRLKSELRAWLKGKSWERITCTPGSADRIGGRAGNWDLSIVPVNPSTRTGTWEARDLTYRIICLARESAAS